MQGGSAWHKDFRLAIHKKAQVLRPEPLYLIKDLKCLQTTTTKYDLVTIPESIRIVYLLKEKGLYVQNHKR